MAQVTAPPQIDAGPMDVDGHEIEVSNPDKVFFPDAGVTKGGLLRHHLRFAPLMLAQVQGRPVMLRRFPDGIEGQGFFQKQLPDHAPDWLSTVDVALRGEDRSVRHLVLDGPAALAWAIQLGTIEVHVWLSSAEALDRPLEAVVDLDPEDPGDLDSLRWATRVVRAVLGELGLPARCKLTGGKGTHVHIPLDGQTGYDPVRRVMHDLAGLLAARHPRRLTNEQRKARRAGRIYVDVARNAFGQTVVVPYGVRARPGAPVAVPLRWDELTGIEPDRYDPDATARRMAQTDDPWQADGIAGVDLSAVADEIAAARQEAERS